MPSTQTAAVLTFPTTAEIHDELAEMQDCLRFSSESAREFWRTMYSRARFELRQPWFGRNETTGFVVGALAHAVLASR